MLAASEGHTEVVVELEKANADLDLQNNVCIFNSIIYIHNNYYYSGFVLPST